MTVTIRTGSRSTQDDRGSGPPKTLPPCPCHNPRVARRGRYSRALSAITAASETLLRSALSRGWNPARVPIGDGVSPARTRRITSSGRRFPCGCSSLSGRFAPSLSGCCSASSTIAPPPKKTPGTALAVPAWKKSARVSRRRRTPRGLRRHGNRNRLRRSA